MIARATEMVNNLIKIVGKKQSDEPALHHSCINNFRHFFKATDLDDIAMNGKIMTTRKGVPELRGPGLVCLSAIDKKSVYWSSSWARSLKDFDVYYFHHHRRCWPTFIQ